MTDWKPTPQEAVKYLKEFLDGEEMCCCCNDDVIVTETAIEALEKQIPQKVIPFTTNGYYKCPICGEAYHISKGNNYCESCGQKLDWVGAY